VLQGRRNEPTILDRDRWMKRHDTSPLVGAMLIEGENARAVAQHQRREPRIEAGRILGADHPLLLDALPELVSTSTTIQLP